MTISSNYHIEVNPSDVGIYDKVVVMELVKSAAQTQQLDSSGQRDFKGKPSPYLGLPQWNTNHKYIVTQRLPNTFHDYTKILPLLEMENL